MQSFEYLACPYSHEDPAVREYRFEKATVAAVKLMQQGVVIFSPITHSHPMAVRHKLPGDWGFWQKFDTIFIQASSGLYVLMLPGWYESSGVQAEIDIAYHNNKPITYLFSHFADE